MRFIPKGSAPAAYATFEASVQDPASANWDRLKRKRHRLAYDALWAALLAEQEHTCCYCGARVVHRTDMKAPDAGHIEHVMPKAARCFPGRKFAYDNLMVSCQGATTGQMPVEPRRCGHAKRDWPDPGARNDFVSPLDPKVSAAFRYGIDGRVKAAQTAREDAAEQTIKRLNLNQARLIANRREAIDAWADLLESGAPVSPRSVPGVRAEPYLACLLDVLDRLGLLPAP